MARPITHSAAIVLQAIARGYRHGFEIIELTGLSGGTIYPALRRMERDHLVRSAWEAPETAQADGRPPRKYYAVTVKGEAALAIALGRFKFLRPFAAELAPRERTS